MQQRGLTHITHLYAPRQPNTFLIAEVPDFHHLPQTAFTLTRVHFDYPTQHPLVLYLELPHPSFLTAAQLQRALQCTPYAGWTLPHQHTHPHSIYSDKTDPAIIPCPDEPIPAPPPTLPLATLPYHIPPAQPMRHSTAVRTQSRAHHTQTHLSLLPTLAHPNPLQDITPMLHTRPLPLTFQIPVPACQH